MIQISVPATSANMGPGFDCMGIALNIYNTFTIQEIQEGLNISGCPLQLCNEKNLIYQSMLQCFQVIGYPPKGYNIHIESKIPLSRGLGSSATCIIGGVLAANEIAGNPLSKKELLSIANKIEGHPDNIAPALFGGIVLSLYEEDKVYYNKLCLPKELKFCALIPDFSLSTQQAREVLPKKISYEDAIFNISHASLLISALLNGNYDLLKHACQDRLHQPYRGELIPHYHEIIEKCKDLDILCTFLSGAGPTIMTILRQENQNFVPSIKKYLNTLSHHWDVIELQMDLKGAQVKSIESLKKHPIK
ncbi:homoserine kinase [Garciella nitratireducens]|uniref:homoserine kinase n=1 Tax=Garciella nitratireducens TaxID=218205 RepID=UPI000DE836F6|nr:homoserine kinase [Garciella nitratireducens]RBP43984.1 homoserine kinase [Garciella nitratireducens]